MGCEQINEAPCSHLAGLSSLQQFLRAAEVKVGYTGASGRRSGAPPPSQIVSGGGGGCTEGRAVALSEFHIHGISQYINATTVPGMM